MPCFSQIYWCISYSRVLAYRDFVELYLKRELAGATLKRALERAYKFTFHFKKNRVNLLVLQTIDGVSNARLQFLVPLSLKVSTKIANEINNMQDAFKAL